jgi:hypothetical protein
MTAQSVTDATEAYWKDGITVFRGLIPESLRRDLLAALEEPLLAARRELGAQATRFKPHASYGIDPLAFNALLELPALRELLTDLLTPEHTLGQAMSVLIEPHERPLTTRWNRGWRSRVDEMIFAKHLRADWDEKCRDHYFFHSMLCPLLPDDALWYVPGSHERQDNLPQELAAEAAYDRLFSPRRATTDNAEIDARCIEYHRSMPGAVRIKLEPGDVALYRHCGWHAVGTSPARPRITLTDRVIGLEEIRYIADREKRYERAQGIETVYVLPAAALPKSDD